MAEARIPPQTRPSDTPLVTSPPPRLPVLAFGMSLGLFLAITFVICVTFDLIFPGQAMYDTWLKLLPGFTWLTLPSFLLGLAESFGYGWFIALVFGPFFNYFSARWTR